MRQRKGKNKTGEEDVGYGPGSKMGDGIVSNVRLYTAHQDRRDRVIIMLSGEKLRPSCSRGSSKGYEPQGLGRREISSPLWDMQITRMELSQISKTQITACGKENARQDGVR